MQTRQDNTRIVYVYLYTVHHFLQFLYSSPNLCRLAKVGVHNWIHNTFYDKWEKTLQLIFCNFCCSLCNFPTIQYTKDTYIKILVNCQTYILNWRTNCYRIKIVDLFIFELLEEKTYQWYLSLYFLSSFLLSITFNI